MSTSYYVVLCRPSVTPPLKIGTFSWGEHPKFTFSTYHNPSWEVPDAYECKEELDTFEAWDSFLWYGTKAGTFVVMDEYDNLYPYKDFRFKIFGYPENGDEEKTRISFAGRGTW